MPHPPGWRFREMGRDEINVDPVHDEFFKAQDLADALVRESVQNSLDARRGNSTVRVRFRFGSGDAALGAPMATRYRAGLDEHLKAIGATVPSTEAAMTFLLIEDFGTRGLAGDPSVDPELDEAAEKNDFYFFWRNVGRSSKSELDRGRWGLGKAVFSVASRIRTIFGLTLRADDSKRLLLGQSVLKTHGIDGHRYAPYGFYGHFATDHFPLPVEDQVSIDRFVTDFGSERSEPGLSVVIPWYREEELRFEQIAESAIRQYFYPITRGDLVVSIEEGSRKETLNPRTIDALAARFSGTVDETQRADRAGSLARLCALTRWSVTVPDDDYIPVAEPPAANAPRWSETIWPAAITDRLQDRYEAGERLAFRVRLPVKRRRSRPRSSYFDVVLEKDESLRRGEHTFIRRGITIPEVRSGPEKSVRALIVVDDEALSSFLGDAENPAHSDWSERADKVRELYEHGAFTVRYVKQSAAKIIAAIARPPQGRFRDLLAEIFSIDVVGSAGERDGNADSAEVGTDGDHGRSRGEEQGAGRAGSGGEFPESLPAPRRPTLTATAGGFTVRGSGDPADVGATFTAEAAYRTRNGNPFKKYSGFDFVVGAGEIALRTEGATVLTAAGNRTTFVADRPDFLVAVSGFDRRRDLVVRVTRTAAPEPAEELPA